MLTAKEIDTLIEALTAWESKDLAGDLMAGLFTAMLTKDDPEAKAKMKEEETQRKIKSEMESRERKERSLLLKAKLVGMKRDGISVEANAIINHD